MAQDPNSRAGAAKIKIKINGTDVPDDEVIRFVVDQDLNQPWMAVITLQNKGHRHSNAHAQGDSVEVQVTDQNTCIFKGELVGLEPTYEAGGESKCVVRAFDKLHRLLRGRKSRTFQKQSDNDIVNAIVGDHGLSAQCDSDVNIKHEHVYKHAQNDLEFLRIRAARIGYAVWVEDSTLHFKKPKTDQDSGIELKISKNPGTGHRIKKAGFRSSSAAVVNSVEVRGWDPEKKEAISGVVNAQSSKLGATNAAGAANPFGQAKTVTVDHPIRSVEEAKAIAQSKLDDASMSFITGEAECIGHPDFKPGIVVKIIVDETTTDNLFNGKYFLTGCAHMYSHGGGGHGASAQGGYTTVLKVARDAQKGQ